MRQTSALDHPTVVHLVRALLEDREHTRSLGGPALVADMLTRLDDRFEDPALQDLDDVDRAILRYLVPLVLAPSTCENATLDGLRSAGLDDAAIHDVVQVACCFSFMNRLADGLGVKVSDDDHAWATELFGATRLDAHLRWAEG